MKYLKPIILTVLACLALGVLSCTQKHGDRRNFRSEAMLIRLSEIEINPGDLEAYLAILREESAASVRLEPGVISIYPMFQKEQPNQIRILEIYADREAYEAHLQTPHFKAYKSKTLHMVTSLKLVDMEAIDGETMPEIFKKLGT